MTSSKVMAAGPGIWSQPLIKSPVCDVSFASVQANAIMEDASQVVIGPEGFFVTVNDGHGGAEASRFATDNLYKHLQVSAAEEGGLGVPALQHAYKALEAAFTELVSRSFEEQPRLACVGTCSLSGLISGDGEQLIVGNLGDTRAVLGTSSGAVKKSESRKGLMRSHGDDGAVSAVQLSTDHNVNIADERVKMEERFPEDKEVVIDTRGSYRVKGRIQVCRTIGDVYMKHQEFNRAPLPASIQLKEPVTTPYLLSEPAIHVRTLRPGDQFAIFASDGLWDLLSNQEAVDIVAHHSKEGIAKRLIRTALERVAKRIDVKYAELERLGVGQRRNLHDDITVVVVFFKPFPKVRTDIPLRIVKGGEDAGSSWNTEPPSPRGNLRLHTTKNRLMHSLACSCCIVDD